MAENEASSSAETDETSFERSVYTEFFEVLEKNGKNIKVLCKVCPPASKKTFSTAVNSTANLKKHLKVFYGGLHTYQNSLV